MSLNLNTLQKAADLANPIISRHAPEDWKKFKELYHHQIEGHPSAVIMMYGMYSHGKSTLVNAILGKEVAQVGKPPTTGALDDYEWSDGHCVLRDTPGIQARAQHTYLADESLRQCALVAFVVESGAIEESDVWDTLARMLKQRQKVCVIVNDFDECRHKPELLEPLKDTLRRHLQDAASRVGFSGDIVAETPILIVNAKQALKGRLEHKDLLVEDAGLPDVEQALIRLASSMDMTDVLNTLKRNLLLCITNCKRQLAANDQKSLLADAEMQLAAIQGQRDRAHDRIEQALDSKLSAMGPSLTALYENPSDEAMMKAQLQSMFMKMMDELSPVIEAETGEAAKQIEATCLEYDKLREHMVENADESGTSGKEILDLVNSFDWKSLLGTINVDLETYAKELVVTVLQQCKKWFPEFFKGIGPATMGRWATTAFRSLGTVISIATVFFQIYNDYQAQQEAENRARRKAEAIRDAVSSTQARLRQSVMAAVNEIFAQSFDKLTEDLSQKINKLAERDKGNSDEREVLLQAEALLTA